MLSMEDMATSDTLRTIPFMDDPLPCDSGTSAARRRRLEIIRFKQFINTGTFPEPAVKRSKRSMTSQSYDIVARSPSSLTEVQTVTEVVEDSSSVESSSRELLSDVPPLSAGAGLALTVPDVVAFAGDAATVHSPCSAAGPGSLTSPHQHHEQQQQQQQQFKEEETQLDDGDEEQEELVQMQVHDDTNMVAVEAVPSPQGQTHEGSSLPLMPVHLVACPPHGSVSVCGRRRTMEDYVSVVPSFVSLPCDSMGGCASQAATPFHFFGVYDGHGGSQVAAFCADRLHRALAEEAKTVSTTSAADEVGLDGNEGRWLRAMSSSFQRIDEEIGGVGRADGRTTPPDPIAPEMVGSTAVVAVVNSCQIVVGNCGDSRAVLSRGGRAIPLSVDHKPERQDELARIEAAGGRVISWGGYRVLGVLAMSRAIGDRYLKPYVISEPEVTCTQRTEDDECLILASDGLWDVIPNDTVCEIARKCLAGRPRAGAGAGRDDEAEESPCSMAAAVLMKLAFAKGSTDNISVVVVDLKAPRRDMVACTPNSRFSQRL